MLQLIGITADGRYRCRTLKHMDIIPLMDVTVLKQTLQHLDTTANRRHRYRASHLIETTADVRYLYRTFQLIDATADERYRYTTSQRIDIIADRCYRYRTSTAKNENKLVCSAE